MNFLKRFISLLCGFFSLFTAQAQKQTATLFETEVYRFTSAIDSLPYVVYIHLPGDSIKPNRKYPVLYVTDAQYFLTPLYGGYGSLHYDGFVPDLIRVGITWPDKYEESRMRDFTPTAIENTPFKGNADKFLSVIKNEVIRYIEDKYPVDTADRALYGTSLGGAFAIYTLFREPKLFHRYIIASPNVDYDKDFLFKMERDFAKKNKTLNAKIFFCLGEYEEAIDPNHKFDKFVEQIAASKYEGLIYKRKIVESMGHSGTSTVGGIMGMQYIYSKPEVVVSSAVLVQYDGRYVISPGDTATISHSGNHLFMRNAFIKAELFADSPQSFYIKGANAKIVFTKNDHNKVDGFDLSFADFKMIAKKIN